MEHSDGNELRGGEDPDSHPNVAYINKLRRDEDLDEFHESHVMQSNLAYTTINPEMKKSTSDENLYDYYN